MNRKWIYIIVASFILGIVVSSIIVFANRISHEASPQFEHNGFTVMIENESVRTELIDTEERIFEHGTDTVYFYELLEGRSDIGKAILTHRKLTDRGGYIFIEIVRDGAEEGTVQIAWEEDSIWHDFTELEYDIYHDPTVGVDEVKGPYGLLDLENSGQILVGRGLFSHDQRLEYDDGHYSRVRVLDKQIENISLNDSSIDIEFSFPKNSERFEMWLMYADEKLIEEKHIDSLRDDMTNHYRRYFKWATPHGIYAKLPWSVEPFDEMGYGRNIGYQFRGHHVEMYEKHEQHYDEMAVLNSLVTIESLKKEFEDFPLLPTEYTSTWLKKPYGIHAPYLDTRHHESLGNFLLFVERVFGFEYQEEFLVYADYLVNALEGPYTIEVGDGVLLADYDGPGIIEIPHASLNHVLGEIYYLLRAYFETDDEKYLDAAYTMRLGIEALGEKWIRTDERAGDLWYQVNADLSFEGNDYPCLTLDDLINNQELWEETKYGKSNVFQMLLDSKIEAGVCER